VTSPVPSPLFPPRFFFRKNLAANSISCSPFFWLKSLLLLPLFFHSHTRDRTLSRCPAVMFSSSLSLILPGFLPCLVSALAAHFTMADLSRVTLTCGPLVFFSDFTTRRLPVPRGGSVIFASPPFSGPFIQGPRLQAGRHFPLEIDFSLPFFQIPYFCPNPPRVRYSVVKRDVLLVRSCARVPFFSPPRSRPYLPNGFFPLNLAIPRLFLYLCGGFFFQFSFEPYNIFLNAFCSWSQ